MTPSLLNSAWRDIVVQKVLADTVDRENPMRSGVANMKKDEGGTSEREREVNKWARDPDRRGGSENLEIPVKAVWSANEKLGMMSFRGVHRHRSEDVELFRWKSLIMLIDWDLVCSEGRTIAMCWNVSSHHMNGPCDRAQIDNNLPSHLTKSLQWLSDAVQKLLKTSA